VESKTELGSVPLPQSLIDAGGEAWESLQQVVTRCLDELLAGDVLEVVSSVVAVRLALPTWCAGMGYELLATRDDGDKSSFWIRKREE
jgi:TusA-related sulfurtransferase